MKEFKEYQGTITTKGQVTLPSQVRKILGIKAHDRVVFRVSDGKVELQPANMSLEDTFGAVAPRKTPEDFQELHDIAVEEHVEAFITLHQQLKGQ